MEELIIKVVVHYSDYLNFESLLIKKQFIKYLIIIKY